MDAPWWMLLHLRSILFECGRLQYNLLRIGRGALAPGLWYGPEEAARRGPGFGVGDPPPPAAASRSLAGQ